MKKLSRPSSNPRLRLLARVLAEDLPRAQGGLPGMPFCTFTRCEPFPCENDTD